MTPAFSSPVTVGTQNQAALISITNTSFGPGSTEPVTITNIRVNASCDAPDGFLCPSHEPRQFPSPILAIDATAFGRAGTSCAGIFLAVSPPNAAGTVVFTPNSPVTLGPPGGPAATCIIDFTFDALQRPLDGAVNPRVEAVASTSQFPGGAPQAGESRVVVQEAPATVAVQATPQLVAEGGAFSALATVTGVAGGPPVTGTVIFRLFNRQVAPDCTFPPVVTSSPVPLTPGPAGPGGAPTGTASLAYPGRPAGDYVVVAAYDGANSDANYQSASSSCADPAARVVVVSPPPSISVTYEANPLSRPAPGGTFTYTVVVMNSSPNEAVTITSLNDNVFGNVATRPGSTCGALIGSVLAPGASSAPCSFTGDFIGPGGSTQTSVMTATVVDDDGQTATDSDDATVALTGQHPSVRVTKTANPTSMPAPGGDFTFTVAVTNTGPVPVTITQINDDIYGNLGSRPGSTCGARIGSVLAPGAEASCLFFGNFTGPPGASQTDVVTVIVVDAAGTQATDTDDATVTLTGVPGPTKYVPLSPARIEDTRTGAGGLFGALGSGATVAVQVTGRGGVPAGASAVVLNVTVTQPTAEGYLSLYPDGTPRPLAANLNFTPGKTVPNLAVVKLGVGGRVAMFNSAGNTHAIYDVAGYFVETAGNAGRHQPLVPARIADTRFNFGGVRLGPGQSIDVQVTGRGGAPATGVSAAVLNVAATETTAESFLTAYPTGETRPLAANLNFLAGETVSNRTMTKVGAGGKVTIYNNAGSTDVVVDIGGTYTDASVPGAQGAYTPLDPSRILDTRDLLGPGPVPAGGTIDVQVTGRGGVPGSGVRAVILNVAVTQPAGAGYLTIFPAGAARPLASDLNYAPGETRANLVVVQVGADGRVSLFTPTQAHVVFDVAGWFS